MKSIKKTGITFYLNCAAGVLAVAGMSIYLVTNATPGYAILNGTLGIVAGVVGILLIVGCTFTSTKMGQQHMVPAFMGLAALALLMVAVGILLSDRAGLASALFTWNSHNTVGWNVFYTSVASCVCLVLAVFVLIINSFIDNRKK